MLIISSSLYVNDSFVNCAFRREEQNISFGSRRSRLSYSLVSSDEMKYFTLILILDIFNEMFRTNVFSDSWKLSNVCLIKKTR